MTIIDDVLKYLIEGNSNQDILEYLQTEGMSPEDARESIQRAFDELEGVADVSEDTRLAWCLESLRELYRKLISSGDYVGAIRAVKEIANLSGLYKSAKGTKEKAPSKQTKGGALSEMSNKKISLIHRKQ